MKTEFPYGQKTDAYLNVKEAAKEPWRGVTAWVQGSPYLVIDKNRESFVIEGENGNVHTLDGFEKWEPATEQSALVAASRVDGSPFVYGARVGLHTVGNLIYFEKEWSARIEDSNKALPLERLVARYDKFRWDKNADMYPQTEMRCPECLSDDVGPRGEFGDSKGDTECYNCGHLGDERDFMVEEPDADLGDAGFYEDWNPTAATKVSEFPEGQMNEFDYHVPPLGIHGTTHKEMRNAGLSAEITWPPGLFPDEPEGYISSLPGRTAGKDAMNTADILEPPNYHIPPGYFVRVRTPHDPEAVRAIFDRYGGGPREAVAKVGERQEGAKCPHCGSHALKAYSMPKGEGTAKMVCLTCGKEHSRDVMPNPQSKIAGPLDFFRKKPNEGYPAKNPHSEMAIQQSTCENCGGNNFEVLTPHEFARKGRGAVSCRDCGSITHIGKVAYNPVDPDLQAQIMGLTQQIQQAYAEGNTQKAQQLQERLNQLVQNPNAPAQTTQMSYASTEDCSCGGDCGCGKKESPGEFVLRQTQADLQKLAPGKEHMKGVSPKRNRQYEDILASCRKSHPDYSEERCKELAARTVNKTRAEKGETKSSIEPVDTIDKFFIESAKWANPYDEYPSQDIDYGSDDDEKFFCKGCGEEFAKSQMKEPFDSFGEGTCPNCGQHDWDDVDDAPYEPDQDEYTGPGDYEMYGPDRPRMEDYVSRKQAWIDGADDPDTPTPQQVDLDQYQQEDPMTTFQDPGMESEYDYAHCPNCDGPGVLLGQLGSRVHHRCRNCGMDFSHKISAVNDDVKLVNQNTLKAFKDSSGADLVAGSLYLLRHPEHKVPDVVKILNLEDNRIEAAIASDEHGAFPIHITHDDVYTLDPYEKTGGWKVAGEPRGLPGEGLSDPRIPNQYERERDPGPDFDDPTLGVDIAHFKAYLQEASDEELQQLLDDQKLNLGAEQFVKEELANRNAQYWQDREFGGGDLPPEEDPFTIWPGGGHPLDRMGKVAVRDFSAQEQRELIDENPDGRARNFDRLDLAGTHYNLKEEHTDPYFLLGL